MKSLYRAAEDWPAVLLTRCDTNDCMTLATRFKPSLRVHEILHFHFSQSSDKCA